MKFGIREIIFIAVMLGLLACSYFLVLTKAQQKVQAQERKIEEKQKALSDLERATAGVSDIDRKVEEAREALVKLGSKVVCDAPRRGFHSNVVAGPGGRRAAAGRRRPGNAFALLKFW